MTDHTDNKVYTPQDAKAVIADRLKSLAADRLPNRLIRIEVEIEKQDILKWLNSQQYKTRFYFSGRDEDDTETAGIGIADSIYCTETLDHKYTFEHMRKHLTPEFPGLRYYGGFSFAPGFIDSDWGAFGTCRFIVPRFELLIKKNRTYLACNTTKNKNNPEEQYKVLAQLEDLNFTRYREFTKPGEVTARKNYPDYDQWKHTMAGVIGELKNHSYTKTVLARKVDLQFENPPGPISILAALKHLPSRRYDFLFQFDGQSAFLGSSPERLYKRSGRAIKSEAVAGTRSRGNEESHDRQQAADLMNSDKERREHDFVVHTVEGELHPLCTSMKTDEKKRLLKLKEGIHLVSYLEGTLKPSVTDEMIVIALHPTPAVGGCPAGKALDVIRESEPFKRGWYAGVIGTVGIDSADFAVGLRSGLVKGNRLSLYSGVGIVEGSNARDEWLELEHKTRNFMDILNTNRNTNR